MTPEDAGVGFHVGDPLADSAEQYSDYPSNREETLSYNYRDVVHEVLDAVSGSVDFAAKELNVDNSSVAAFTREHEREYSDDLLVTLKGATVETHKARVGNVMVDISPQTFNILEFDGGDPLKDSEFLTDAHEREYDPEDVAALFDGVDARDVKDAMIAEGLIERDYVEIDGERHALDNYNERPYRDGRLLEAMSKAGWSVAEVARTLAVDENLVREQLDAHRLL